MSAAIMALAEISKSHKRRTKDLEAEVTRLQAILVNWELHAKELYGQIDKLRDANEQLNHSFGLYDLGAERDAKRIGELQADLAQAQGYGQAMYESLLRVYRDIEGAEAHIPKPPWLAGDGPDGSRVVDAQSHPGGGI